MNAEAIYSGVKILINDNCDNEDESYKCTDGWGQRETFARVLWIRSTIFHEASIPFATTSRLLTMDVLAVALTHKDSRLLTLKKKRIDILWTRNDQGETEMCRDNGAVRGK